MVTLTLVAILLVALLSYRNSDASDQGVGRMASALDSRWILAVVGAVTVAVIWTSWATWHPFPVVHDEMAYVLQSQIFARGRWALPSPAIPEFFEQPHVLVVPSVAEKYFPGHALVLTVGALVGLPALMPLVLQAVIAILLFVLARRVANGGVALLSWILWLTSPIVLYFGASFYSEATTTACWLAGWYALLEWRAQRKLRWLLAVAFFTGWGAITRPLTGLAYAIPLGVVVLSDVYRTRRWRDLSWALVMGVVVLAILPLWSARTTGDWRVTPQTLYTQQYMPYDVPGFGMRRTPPERPLTLEIEHLNQAYSRYHVTHYPSTLLKTLVQRAAALRMDVWGSSGGVMMIFAMLGVFTLTGPTVFAVGSALFLFLVYLLYATPPSWTLYYYETVPALAFLTASGLAWAAALTSTRPRRLPGGWRSPRLTSALVAGALVLCIPGARMLEYLRVERRLERVPQRRFALTVEALPDRRAVIFVRYSPVHDSNVAWVQNSANPAAERVWIVYDRGEQENARLLALSPERVPYLFDEMSHTLFRYPRPEIREASLRPLSHEARPPATP